MIEQDGFGAGTQGNASRCERAIFLLLIRYMTEELARPALRVTWSFVARSFHFPAGPRLRH